MITGSKEYEEFLLSVANSFNPPDVKIRIPSDEPIYEINLDTRSVSAPTYVGVEADHEAEFVWFKVDRFFDHYDLKNTICLVQFRNAKHEEFYYVVPYYDVSEKGKLIFAWDIQSPVTKYGGVVTFSFKFFKINTTTGELLFELNTLPVKTRVMIGWANAYGANHTYNAISADEILVNNDFLTKVQQLADVKNKLSIYWIDAPDY